MKALTRLLLTAAALGMSYVGAAVALEEAKDEKDKLRACEASLCKLISTKTPTDGDFSCPLSKTWAKAQLAEGSASGKVTWGLGDARCSLELKIPRSALLDALSKPAATLQFPEQTVNCEIEQDKAVTPVKATLAPKFDFKDGKAVTAWVNLKEVGGPTAIKALAHTVAKLEDGLGIFHKSLVKSFNEQLHEKCDKLGKTN